MNPSFVRDGTELAIAEMLRGGTTCFNDMYFFPDVVARAAAEHGMRAVVGMIVVDFPTPWAETPAEYFSKGLAVHDAYRNHPLVSTAFAPHAPYSVSDTTFAKLRQLADQLEVPVHMHVHESADEVAASLREIRPAAARAARGARAALAGAPRGARDSARGRRDRSSSRITARRSCTAPSPTSSSRAAGVPSRGSLRPA